MLNLIVKLILEIKKKVVNVCQLKYFLLSNLFHLFHYNEKLEL